MSLKRLHTLLSKTGNIENKREIILEATEGRSSSSKDLNAWEMKALLGKLQALANSSPEEQSKDRMRKKVIGLLKEANYKMPEIYKWIETTFKKSFNEYSSAELTQIIYAAEGVRDHFLGKIRKSN